MINERWAQKNVVQHNWMMLNIQKFADKKDNVNIWNPATLFYMPTSRMGKSIIILSDTQIISDLMEDQSQFDRQVTTFGGAIWGSQLGDNIFNISRGPEQTERRRTYIKCFSDYNLIDKTVEKVFGDFVNKVKNTPNLESHVWDLREEMVHIYERVVTTFVFGVDAADELI